ncbi:U20-hexatoxin-Hi1a-like [Brevipalpus obovatus]|uniref:U20-hexatoxin-Hi1a-like n=1 Tax=Brevipalpus obovatus TaxID=246614 RepID=UPI003D9F55BC
MAKFSILVIFALCALQSAFADGDCHADAQKPRDKSLHLVPRCEEDGTYKPLQCFPVSMKNLRYFRFCQCWNAEGSVLSAPSASLKNDEDCECFLSQDQLRKKEGSKVAEETIRCDRSGRRIE